jgi:hypothetical protein
MRSREFEKDAGAAAINMHRLRRQEETDEDTKKDHRDR